MGHHRHSARRRQSGVVARRQDDRVLVDGAACRSDVGAEAGRRQAARDPTCASSPKPCIAPTASRAAGTSTAIARRTSGLCPSRATASDKTTPVAVTSGEFAATQPSLVHAMASRIFFTVRSSARVVLLPRRQRPVSRSRKTAASRPASSASRVASAPTRSRPTASASRSSAFRRATPSARTRSPISGSPNWALAHHAT